MSPYLGLNTRSLDDLAADIEQRLESLKLQLSGWRSALSSDPQMPPSMRDVLGPQIDAMSDEIGRLEAQLEEIDDELEHRREREDGSHSPIVL